LKKCLTIYMDSATVVDARTMPKRSEDLYKRFIRTREQRRKDDENWAINQAKRMFEEGTKVDLPPEIKLELATDISGAKGDPDNIINITLDMSDEGIEKAKKEGKLVKARDWTEEDAATHNPVCKCGCGRRGPWPAVGDVVPVGWLPTQDESTFVCTDAVTPLQTRHESHTISSIPEESDNLKCE
jgi:hypothetical protein